MTNTRRERLFVLAVVTALAWWYVLRGAGISRAMPGMDGMTSPTAIFAMWGVMMAAMMLPSAAPWIAARGVPFAIGYVVVWTAFGAMAALVQLQLDRAGVLSEAMALRNGSLAALVVAAAGLYEFVPLKSACLRRCRPDQCGPGTPATAGIVTALESGVHQGIFCVGCCWMLMALLFVAGVMNVIGMAAIAFVVLTEKLFPFRVGRMVGVALVLCAAVMGWRAGA